MFLQDPGRRYVVSDKSAAKDFFGGTYRKNLSEGPFQTNSRASLTLRLGVLNILLKKLSHAEQEKDTSRELIGMSSSVFPCVNECLGFPSFVDPLRYLTRRRPLEAGDPLLSLALCFFPSFLLSAFLDFLAAHHHLPLW